MNKKKSDKNKLIKEQMRDKTTGEFLNDQLLEHGITDTGDMLSMYNTDSFVDIKKHK